MTREINPSTPCLHMPGLHRLVLDYILFRAGCKKATLNSTVGTYAAELAREETAHVKFLYTALTQAGASPVCPFVNIGEPDLLGLAAVF